MGRPPKSGRYGAPRPIPSRGDGALSTNGVASLRLVSGRRLSDSHSSWLHRSR